jgi:bifunctional DNA-binding transcriptional regulator/antitoxin component of YhaV-PrlF toxin-antitoxin module
MPKVTSKLQMTVPKAIADQFGLKPRDELQWTVAGEAIRVTPLGKGARAQEARSVKERLEVFDQATERQRRRQAKIKRGVAGPAERGCKREDLYGRNLSD